MAKLIGGKKPKSYAGAFGAKSGGGGSQPGSPSPKPTSKNMGGVQRIQARRAKQRAEGK